MDIISARTSFGTHQEQGSERDTTEERQKGEMHTSLMNNKLRYSGGENADESNYSNNYVYGDKILLISQKINT